MGLLNDRQLRDIKSKEDRIREAKTKAAKARKKNGETGQQPDQNDLPAKRKSKTERLHDGDGLYFVHRGGSLSWSLKWMQNGTAHEMSLGQYDEVSLADARQKARDAHRLIGQGLNPIEAKKNLRNLKIYTFKEVAEECIQAKQAAWGNGKHIKQWPSTLAQYVYPVIGEKPVPEVSTDHVLEILKPIWTTKTETASRVRGRIETVLNYAKTRGWRSGENPATWRGHLQNTLSAPSKVTAVKHHPAVPWADLPPRGGKTASEGFDERVLPSFYYLDLRSVGGGAWCPLERN